MGSALRSFDDITDESWLASDAVRSWSASALTWTLVERPAMGRTIRSGAAKAWMGARAAVALMAGAMVTDVLMVLNPGSETTRVKLPGCGGRHREAAVTAGAKAAVEGAVAFHEIDFGVGYDGAGRIGDHAGDGRRRRRRGSAGGSGQAGRREQ